MTNRIAGGWAHLIDRARDLGAPLSPRTTRTETAAVLLERFPGTADLPVGLRTLARRADAGVFGTGEPSQELVEGYWRDVEEASRAMCRSAGRWRRLVAPFELASLRRFW